MNPPRKFPRQTYAILAVGLAIGFVSGAYTGRRAGNGASGANDADRPGEIGTRGERERPRGRRIPGSQDADPGAGQRTFSKAESKEFAESVRSIFRETMEDRRVAMFESMLDRVGIEHYADVVSLIRENDLRGSDSGVEWSRLWASWGRRDPAGAFEFIKSQDWNGWDPRAPAEARNKALTSWAQSDPDRARKFVEEGAELASGDRSLVYGLVRGWSDVDPNAAAEWLSKSGLGMSGEYKSVVESISRKGGREALDAWFSGLDEKGISAQDKRGFAQVIAEVKQEYEPEKAAAWVEQHLDEPWLAESEIVESTAQAFASRDPKGAMEWAAKTGLESAAAIAMGTWCQQDLPAASTWLSENSRNPAYAEAASMVVAYLQRNDPAAAATWAGNLPDPALRNRLLEQLQGR